MPSKRKPNQPLDELRQARLLEVRERITRLKRENAWGAGQVVLKADHDRVIGHLGLKTKAVLYSKMENELPVQLEGLDACAIRIKLRDAADGIMDEMVDFLKNFNWQKPPRLPETADALRWTQHNEEETDT